MNDYLETFDLLTR